MSVTVEGKEIKQSSRIFIRGVRNTSELQYYNGEWEFRIPFTKNQKGGYFAIPFGMEGVTSHEEIPCYLEEIFYPEELL